MTATTSNDTRDRWDLDPSVASRADRGVPAARKRELRQYDAPLHVLAANGVEVPHRDYDHEQHREYPTSVEIDGRRVHLHQDVRESMSDEFGDFSGLDDEDDESVTWTVVDLTDGSVTLTVVGDWSKRRDVPFEEFPENYDPIYVTEPLGDMGGEPVEVREVPRYGY